MFEELKKQLTSLQILIGLLIIAVGIYVIQILWSFLSNFSDIFIILLAAWLLSFMLEPVVYLQNKYLKFPKILAAVVVYLLFFGVIAAVIFLFIPVVSSQLQSLSKVLPKYISSAPPFMHRWLAVTTSYLDNSLPIITGVAQFFLDLFLVLVISFYFVIDKERLSQGIYQITPRKWRSFVKFTQELIDTTFASFLRVQLLFGLLSGIGTWIILRLFNVDFAISSSLLSGVLTVIPLIGPVLALIPPLLIPALTNPTQAILIFLALMIIQQVIFSIIGPKLMSRAFKLHPVIVLLSFLIGYKIAGAAGAIFAVPVAGILAVIVQQINRYYHRSKETK